MREFWIILVCSLLLAAPAATLAARGQEDAGGGRYLVAFAGDALPAAGETIGGAKVVGAPPMPGVLAVETRDARALEAWARADPRVRYIERDAPGGVQLLAAPDDPLYGHSGHWGSKKIGAEAAWDRTRGSAAVKVAHIDSGVHRTHEDLQGRLLQGHDFANGDSSPDDVGGACDYHGTHTTATAGATIGNARGIAGLSQHTILPVKAFEVYRLYGCSATLSAIASSLRYAADEGSHVISNSWGAGSSSSTLNDAVTYAAASGALIVAAAGNSGPCSGCVSYPWRDVGDRALVVSATGPNDEFARYSSAGPQVDLAAPGDSIISACGSAPDAYCVKSGTSMAAPHVAGSAALLKALQPSWSAADLERVLKENAANIGLPADQQGAGRLDIAAAAARAAGDAPPPPPSEPGPAPEPGPTVHVHGLDIWRRGSTPYFRVSVADGAEEPAGASEVRVRVCKLGGTCVSGGATTRSDGTTTFFWRGAGSGTYELCVTSLSRSGATWDEAGGHASAGNCHTARV